MNRKASDGILDALKRGDLEQMLRALVNEMCFRHEAHAAELHPGRNAVDHKRRI